MSLSELWSLYGQNYIDALLATWGMTLESFAIAMVLAFTYMMELAFTAFKEKKGRI